MSKRRREGEGEGEGGEEEEGARREDLDEEEHLERLERRRVEYAKLGERYEEFMRCATKEQIDRFDHYKRSKFPRAAMRKLMSEVLGHSTDRGAIVLSTMAKMFVGEMVEYSREQMTAKGEEGPIQPCHLRHAYRYMQEKGVVPCSPRYRQTAFWRPTTGS